ncbi:MAG: efflux RND transporter periplasmic adaptor subunit [Anaerolineales bacterium]|nr:efflux RND transporter periplasmic adaptor subunit [Anaerolineales bacterium]
MKKTLLSTLILISIFLTACSGANTPVVKAEPAIEETDPNTITAEGTLLPSPSVELAFAQGGIVAEILVQPGDKVTKGDVIARLVGIETVQAELAAAQLEQTLAQQALDALHRNALLTSAQTEQALLDAQDAYKSEANGWNLGNTDEASDLELTLDDYVNAEEEYTKSRDKLDSLMDKEESNRERRDAQEDFDKEKESLTKAYTDLLTSVAENDQPLDEELTSLLKSIGDLEVAREMQSKLDESNLDPEVLAVAESRLEAAKAHVTAAEATIELYELRAPINGILLSLDLNVGETVTPTLPVAFLADTSRWTVETKDLAEIYMADIAIGDIASVKLDAFPDEEFLGTVTDIDPVGTEYLGDMTYKVTITLDETDPRFLWNMTATVNVNIK